ncbi:MAG TPA: translation initiation factor IF-2 associated domain-containing protein, partial [Burkholderiales bacterium]|nr:translation initiation factor IF-2 associated domain-containing protein [Burkholderiales bacterium]
MAQINVTQFAQQLGLPPALLIEQLQAAGVNKALAEDTPLTEKDKTQLLEHLRKSHGAGEAKQKITLTRRQTTEIKKSDGLGKSRTIQIEVRKKRVLVKRDAAEPDAQSDTVVKPVLDAEQIALREAEARQQAELAARQTEDAENKRRKKEADAVAEAEAKAPEEVRPAVAGAGAASVEGTLHKPMVKPEEKAQKAEKKAKKQQVREVVWKDDTVKRRSIKTRGDVTGGLGWRARKARPGHATHTDEGEAQRAFA